MPTVERDKLPDSGRNMLKLIASQHGAGKPWITRAELAAVQGKKQLNPGELVHLDYLYALGFIEAMRPVGTLEYHYRITETENASSG